MFVVSGKKGSAVLNGLILFAVVGAAVLTVLLLVKMKPDPKDTTSQRFTLGLGHKK